MTFSGVTPTAERRHIGREVTKGNLSSLVLAAGDPGDTTDVDTEAEDTGGDPRGGHSVEGLSRSIAELRHRLRTERQELRALRRSLYGGRRRRRPARVHTINHDHNDVDFVFFDDDDGVGSSSSSEDDPLVGGVQ